MSLFSMTRYFLFFLLSILFLLVFSAQTSPLMNNYGGDSAMFILLGKMFNQGKIPYTDFFDHKGPVLIIIEAVGLHLSSDSRTGIFLLQCINLFITQFLIYKLARNFSLLPLLALSAVILSLLMFSFTIQGGNSSEEWSLPYLYSGLFLTISIDKNISIKRYVYIFILGISAALLFWIRANNMGVICACIIYLSVLTVMERNIKDFCCIGIAFILGFISITVPLIIYFIRINALQDMIYASLLFNMRYIEYIECQEPFSLINFIKGWGSCVVLLVAGIMFYLKKRDFRIVVGVLCLLFIAIITTQLGLGYFHYMTLNLPLFSIGTVFLLMLVSENKLSNRCRSLVFAVSLLLLSAYTVIKINNTQYLKDQDDSEFIVNAKDIAFKIPMNEVDSVFGYCIPTRFWLINDMTPCYRFFSSQEWHGLHDKQILNSVNNFIETDKPLWVILPSDFGEEDSSNLPFFTLIRNRYSLIYRNPDLRLYKKYK